MFSGSSSWFGFYLLGSPLSCPLLWPPRMPWPRPLLWGINCPSAWESARVTCCCIWSVLVVNVWSVVFCFLSSVLLSSGFFCLREFICSSVSFYCRVAICCPAWWSLDSSSCTVVVKSFLIDWNSLFIFRLFPLVTECSSHCGSVLRWLSVVSHTQRGVCSMRPLDLYRSLILWLFCHD